MTNREFMTFVKRPRFVEHYDAIRLFEDDDQEANSKVDYKRTCIIMVPFVLFYIVYAFIRSETSIDFINDALVYFTTGILMMWTFTEYFFHRFVLHKELTLDPDAKADPEKNA
jgi:hypothetical protein